MNGFTQAEISWAAVMVDGQNMSSTSFDYFCQLARTGLSKFKHVDHDQSFDAPSRHNGPAKGKHRPKRRAAPCALYDWELL